MYLYSYAHVHLYVSAAVSWVPMPPSDPGLCSPCRNKIPRGHAYTYTFTCTNIYIYIYINISSCGLTQGMVGRGYVVGKWGWLDTT